jgi:DNA primase
MWLRLVAGCNLDNPLVDKFCAQFNRTVEPAGKGKYKCLCPFHDETSPSFFLYVENETYFCFGCRKWGFLSDLVGAEPDLQLRLNHALSRPNMSIEFGFALACLRVSDKSKIWSVMQRFDDAPNEEGKQEIFEKILKIDLI